MARTITDIKGNSQRLDGGAMFGNAPKAIWSKWIDVDDQNRIQLACRAMLVQEEDKNILCETGIGSFFAPKYKERYGVIESHHVLLDSLKEPELSHEDIHFVILSHLHFDHAGGLLSDWRENHSPGLLFPNATYLVSKAAWRRACHPHPRDRASFIPELPELLEHSGRLEIIEEEHTPLLGEDYLFHFSEGHTPGMMLTEINMPDGPIVFAADLIPGCAWVHLPITMGYDRFAERAIEEKQSLLTELMTRNGRLFYTHDPRIALSRIEQNEKNRFVPTDCLESLNKLDR